jgi:metallo-beta-lactamase class B
MRFSITLLIITCFSLTVFCQERERIIITEDLQIIKISENVLMHVSFMHTEKFGKVGCNGVIYMNSNEAVFLDTPNDEKQTRQLLDWFSENYPEAIIKGVVINHFHEDCLGGLRLFHEAGIKSYSHQLTPTLILNDSIPRPQITFAKAITMRVGKKNITCFYFGEAHTKDNIVTWIPDENVLFGGCMIKALNASKGNLADANEAEWSNTVSEVKRKFRSAKVVIPGHGDPGGIDLLDYTIELFKR